VKASVRKINMSEGIAQTIDDMVAVEALTKITVNGKHAVTLFSLPEQLKELGIGWLLSQAIVASIDEITGVEVRKDSVRIRCSSNVESRLEVARITEPIDSSCGSTPEDFAFLMDRLKRPFVSSNYRIGVEKLFAFVRVLNEKAVLFKLTGGTHSAAIFHKERLIAFAEDVGRHNAVDKVIGAAAMNKVAFSKCVIMSSGRQPANMVLKAARVGIPIVASVAGPMSSGIDAARKTGVTLVCFVRGQRANVYSCPERIEVVRTCSSK
jgi:formate dehydrogenase accessory protein FdhD